MVSSGAKTVDKYLAELPAERREVVATVRRLVNKHMPKAYVETMNWGMICWEIPLARYPITYNGQPLAYVALAAQKNNYALYLMGVYGKGSVHEKLAAAYKAAGLKLDMGKSCLRFKKMEDLLLDAVAAAIAAVGVDDYIAHYEAVKGIAGGGTKGAGKKGAAKKVVTKKGAATKAPAGKTSGKKTARKAPKK